MKSYGEYLGLIVEWTSGTFIALSKVDGFSLGTEANAHGSLDTKAGVHGLENSRQIMAEVSRGHQLPSYWANEEKSEKIP